MQFKIFCGLLIVTIIIIPLNDAIQDLLWALYGNDNNNPIERWNSRSFAISSLHRELSPTRTLKWPECNHVQIMCHASGACDMQYVVSLMVGRHSSAIRV